MDARLALLCIGVFCNILHVNGQETTTRKHYKTNFAVDSDQRGETSNVPQGFVEPLDFAAFTQQFFGGSSSALAGSSFGGFTGADVFGAESKDESKNLATFPASPFEEERQNNTGFVQPVRFVSSFDGQGTSSRAIYQPHNERPRGDLTGRANEEESEPEVRVKPGKHGLGGKSSYPSAKHQKHQYPLLPTASEVEVFYPEGRAILPQLNGRPRPYDGYRAAPDTDTNDAAGKYSERRPQIVYGRRKAEQPTYIIRRRRTTEEQDQSNKKEEATTEEEVEEEVEPEGPGKYYQYKHENNFKIPKLKIKSYPFEKLVKGRANKQDNREAATEEADEFTAGYLSFKQSLPSDLEKFYGAPELEERYTVSATENLETNQNCKKVEKVVKKEDIVNGEVAGVARQKRDADKQVCYTCTDPKTGGSYEQCAYQTDPQSQKYFFGGATSYSTKEDPKSVKYRYRRSLEPFDYEYYFYDRPTTRRVAREQPYYEPTPYYTQQTRPKRKPKKIQKESSNNYRQAVNLEQPPSSYDGPSYTYEGPKFPYEGPSEPYEGPASPYEGPSEEYYDTTDDRIGKNEKKAHGSYQSAAPSKTKYHSHAKPISYTANHHVPYSGPKSEVEEFEGGQFRAGSGYVADYRFGPEHFREVPLKSEDPPQPEESSTSASDEEPFVGSVKVYKNGDICEKKKKDNMVCMECKNSKTGGTYQQCQYSSKPKEKFYTFGRAKSYTNGSPSQERRQRNTDQQPEKSDVVEKKILITKTRVYGEEPEELVLAESRHYNPLREFLRAGDLTGAFSEKKEEKVEGPVAKGSQDVERVERDDTTHGLDEYLYGSPDSDKDGYASDSYKSYDDYFKHLFPELSRGESEADKYTFDPFANLKEFRGDQPEYPEAYAAGEAQQGEGTEQKRLKDRPSRIPAEFYSVDDDEHKKNLEIALGEFQNKDWSKCKKITKNKLTCYQCVDQNGVNNEECMYVEESQPVATLLAYHEKKDFKPEEKPEESKATLTVANTTDVEPHVRNVEPHVRNARGPKHAREDIIAVTEVPQETMRNEQVIKGDMEGVETVPTTTIKPRKKNRRVQKKRNKTAEVDIETTTEKLRKRRKYPVKKFVGETEKADNVLEGTTTAFPGVEGITDASVVQIFFNTTDSPR